jgi:hypothetical protein
MRVFARNLGVRVIRVNAAERYFAALKGVAFLAQGTIPK